VQQGSVDASPCLGLFVVAVLGPIGSWVLVALFIIFLRRLDVIFAILFAPFATTRRPPQYRKRRHLSMRAAGIIGSVGKRLSKVRLQRWRAGK
jgi:hypothetical protein